jgi:hypothetical protein
MKITVIPLAMLVGFVQTAKTALPRPTVTSLFVSREVERGAAFMIECRNTTSAGISSGSETWALTRSAVRIDGAVLDEQGRIRPGLTTEIPPGGVW